MKYIFRIVLSVWVWCPVWAHAGKAEKNVTYLPVIEVQDKEVRKENRNVALSMSVDLSRARIRTQHTVALTPVLVSRDGKREAAFPPVVVDGGTRNRVYLRAQRLKSVELPPYHNDETKVVIRRRNGKEQTYDYTASLPYERWMLDGRVELREEVHGCVNCGSGESEEILLSGIIPEFIPDYRLATIAPEPEPVKVRAETRTARLQFRQDSYKIQPDFRNNRAELDTVSNSILLVKRNEDVKITGIYISGYASPEGSMAHNLTLSENRAKALAEYIRRHDDISPELIHVEWHGEDWDGFIRALDDYPQLLRLDRIRELIAQYPDSHDYCEREFRKLQPAEIYQRLLNEVYPPLRRNEYKIEYNVRNFDLQEARRMVDERPDLLSLQEMYKVAGSYEKGSVDYKRVMDAAARYFPDKPAVLNDRALDALGRGDTAEAIAGLEMSGVMAQQPVLLNTLGVAYARSGELHKAEELFRRAAELGSDEARHNLDHVRQVIDQL
ncbi:DUF3868 domain-containing protein [Alistipes sp.]|uniref:DUF3868 domain-containing protein n=1 Tax=Alistipes sp. TaxID=1872444 RepID=UPI003AB1CD24